MISHHWRKFYEKNLSTQQKETTKDMRFPSKNGHPRGAQSHQPSSPQGTQVACRLKLGKALRLRTRNQFQNVIQKRTRFFGREIVLHYCPSKHLRLGITASRVFGNAVRRNRFKRLVREAFRLYQYELPPLDMVVLPKKGVEAVSLQGIQSDFFQFINAQRNAQSTSTKSR